MAELSPVESTTLAVSDCDPNLVRILIKGYSITTGLVVVCLFPALSVCTFVTMVVEAEYTTVATPVLLDGSAARDASLRIEEGTGSPFAEQSLCSEEMRADGLKPDWSLDEQDFETQIRRAGRKGVEAVKLHRPRTSSQRSILTLGFNCARARNVQLMSLSEQA